MNLEKHIEASLHFDHHSSAIGAFVETVINGFEGNKEKAIALYYAVRDSIFYSPSTGSIGTEALRASEVLELKKGNCIDKAVVLIACLRHIGIPSRIGLAKVQNHIATEAIEKRLGTSVLVPHGYVDLFLENKWVKCTPAFNKSLCAKYQVSALDFDGEEDSLFQQHRADGSAFMEYLCDYGVYSDLPLALMESLLVQYYGKNYRALLGGPENPRKSKQVFQDRTGKSGSPSSFTNLGKRDPVSVFSNDLNKFVHRVF